MTRVGIEKMNLYAGTLVLDIEKLARARGRDADFFTRDLMIQRKSQLVDYEDVITMAVNAARPILTDEDREAIELCIFATESGLDYCKSNSTYLVRHLGLKPQVRNFEVKNACYAATCAIQMAAGWIASGMGRGKKALVVSSDINYDHQGRAGEEVPAIGAVAIVVSEQPRIVEYELGKVGYYSFECTDYARPTATWDIINGQESLYAYLECLEGAWQHYKQVAGDVDLRTHFARIVYHTPFGGLVKMAHGRILKDIYGPLKKAEIAESFERMVAPSLRIAKEVGNTYSSTVYTCLMSLILDDEALRAGDRIGLFSYGSGSAAEFYSAIVLPGAREALLTAGIDDHLRARRELTIEEFDGLSAKRSAHAVDKPTYETDLGDPPGWYDERYRGRGLLVFRGAQDFLRRYEWS